MKQKDKGSEKLRGSEGFDRYYSEIYGERWSLLKEKLLLPVEHAEYSYGGCKSYFLDAASVVSALCLPVKGCEKVLDLCAAPGGKTLVLAGNLSEHSILYSNERSFERKNRLCTVVKECLPDCVSEKVRVSCSDGSLWCKKEMPSYDSILLDAPCSSERHVLTDPKYLKDWSPNRIKTVSMEQWALLSSAWRILKTKGYLLYSTCALAPSENDGNVFRLIKKFPDAETVEKDEMRTFFLDNLSTLKASLTAPSGVDFAELFDCAQKTEAGFHIVPDSAYGAGPLYFSLIKKK